MPNPQLVGEQAYLSTASGRLHLFSLLDGVPRWTGPPLLQTGLLHGRLPSRGRVVPFRGRVEIDTRGTNIVVAGSRDLMGLEDSSGQLSWRAVLDEVARIDGWVAWRDHVAVLHTPPPPPPRTGRTAARQIILLDRRTGKRLQRLTWQSSRPVRALLADDELLVVFDGTHLYPFSAEPAPQQGAGPVWQRPDKPIDSRPSGYSTVPRF